MCITYDSSNKCNLGGDPSFPSLGVTSNCKSSNVFWNIWSKKSSKSSGTQCRYMISFIVAMARIPNSLYVFPTSEFLDSKIEKKGRLV